MVYNVGLLRELTEGVAMVKRLTVPAGTKYEDIVGYSRAVRIGDVVEVAGTTATDDQGEVVGIGNPYAQTKFALAKIDKALAVAGASFKDVVRTRLFVTDIARWEEIGRAHGEVFGAIKPACTMVQVASLIDPEMLVEIEVTAVVDDGR
jgi:enamine deaminase RidA (YjgF/YER057c/UK114 family)